jgi:hypothetical protein
MDNPHDLAVVASDFCECAFAAWSRSSENTQNSPFDSGARQPLANLRWSLHVSLPSRTSWSCCLLLKHVSTLVSSWEFAITLGYEWSIIWGRRPYLWTIWVCDRRHFFWVSSSIPEPLRLIYACGRSTRLHAWQPSRLYYLL